MELKMVYMSCYESVFIATANEMNTDILYTLIEINSTQSNMTLHVPFHYGI